MTSLKRLVDHPDGGIAYRIGVDTAISELQFLIRRRDLPTARGN